MWSSWEGSPPLEQSVIHGDLLYSDYLNRLLTQITGAFEGSRGIFFVGQERPLASPIA